MADMGGGGGSTSFRGGKYTQRSRKRQVASSALMLTAMMDILTTILFFLMKNYSTIQSDFAQAKDLNLPYSTSISPPKAALQLVVSKDSITLDDQPISKIVDGDIDKKDLEQGALIVPLAQELKRQKDRSMYIQNHSDNHSFTGSIVMQADKTLKFNVLKKVLYTAGMMDFTNLKLAVLKKDEG